MVAATRATEVDSAIEALDFETEPLPNVASTRLEGLAIDVAVSRFPQRNRLLRNCRI
jgi:hypothetical protein